MTAAWFIRQHRPELLRRLAEADAGTPDAQEIRGNLADAWVTALEGHLGEEGMEDVGGGPAAWVALSAATGGGRETGERHAQRFCRVAVTWLGEQAAGGDLPPDQMGVAAVACAALTGELLANLAARPAPGTSPLSPGRLRQRQRLLELLLTGSFDDERPLQRMAIATGIRLAANFRVLAVQGPEADEVERLVDPRRVLVGRDEPGNLIVLLTEVADQTALDAAAQPLVEAISEHPGGIAGIGAPARTLAQVGRSHMEAVEALGFARVQGAAGVHMFADIALFAAIRQHPHDVQMYVDSVLGPAEQHPSFRKLDLANVLTHYLETASLDKTAKRLRLHKQTVAYRLRRAGELLKVDLGHQADRFRVYLALMLRKSSGS